MQTDRLFRLVHEDSLYHRPIAERHRIVFYIGHLEAFDWNLLLPRLPGLRAFDTSLDRLFAFGIDPVDGGLPRDQPADWPALDAVRRYQSRIRERLDAVLTDTSFADWSQDESPATILNTAIEHRLMHAETLAYMLHQLPVERKGRERQAQVAAYGTPEPGVIGIPAGAVTLGLPRAGARFGWDNEFDAHTVNVPAFAIDRHKVTNAQFLRFVQAGGYQEQSLWTPEAWRWKAQQGITHPLFWEQRNIAKADGGWRYRTMFDEIPLPADWPVYVSHAEAAAYARWAGMRLPAEAEWQRAAYGAADGLERSYPWGEDAPGADHGYFDFARWDPAPVHAFPHGRSAFGVEGLLANGWEWTSSLFEPFPGFEPFPFYPGYSANFFDGLHYVMKGGSTRTGACMLRREFRNWFQPHYPYVYAGFRCAC